MQKIIVYTSIFLMFINVLYAFSGVLNFSIQSIDLYSNWLLKAKLFFLSPSFPYEFFQDWANMASHPQYPVLLPLLFSFIYSLIGSVQEKTVLLLYPILYIAILLLCFFTLRKRFSVEACVVITYLYSMFPTLLAQAGRGHAGNADLVLTILLWCVAFLIYESAISLKKMFLLALLIAVASQMKSEGFFFSAILLFVPFNQVKKLAIMILASLPFIFWNLFVYFNHFASDIVFRVPSISMFFERVLIIVRNIFLELGNLKNWYIFWPVFFMLVSFKPKLSKTSQFILVPSLFLMLLGYVSVYVFGFFAKTEVNTANYVSSSFDRVLLQLSPLFLILFAEMLMQFLDRQQLLRRFSKFNQSRKISKRN